MLHQPDHGPAEAISCAALMRGHTGRGDADLAIAMLGPRAARPVPTATTLHLGQWLGWPSWLRDGTSLSGTGPLPPTITLADDLLIVGNIIDNADCAVLLERMLTSLRPVMGTTGTLSLLHAPDLGSGLAAILGATNAQNPFMRIAIAVEGSEARIAFVPVWPLGPLYDFAVLAGTILLYRTIEALRGADLAAMSFETRLAEAPLAKPMLARFACRISSVPDGDCLRLPAEWLAIPNPHHDPMLWTIAQAKIAALVNELGDPEILRRIRDYIVAMMAREQRVPRLKQTASHLGLSSRTIARMLARHGTSFHALIEEERKAKALTLIADPTIPLARAALQLGFGDLSSFGRSVRHWFEDTPANLRRTWSARAAQGSAQA